MSGIDHLVLATRDLDAARARYQALGFTLTPPARHPFGTANSLVQLQGSFLELLAIAAPDDIPEASPGRFSFAAFNRDYLAKAEGFSMLVLASEDARAEGRRMRAAGLDTYEPFDFSRRARLPSGDEVTVGFSLSFTTHPAMPDAGFFYCQQHAPEHFWKAEYQAHANTAVSVDEVGLVAEEPAEIATFMAAFAATGAHRVGRDGLAVDTARGRISMLNRPDFRAHWGFAAPAAHRGSGLAAFRLGVADMGKARAIVEASGMAAAIEPDRVVVAPEHLFGAGMVLAQRSQPMSDPSRAIEKTGRQFLEDLMAGIGSAPLGVRLGFRLCEVGDGFVVFSGLPSADYYNPANTIHGGWAAAILDSALGCAVHTQLEAGVSYSTIELKVNYVRAMTERTGEVLCRGEVIHMGRRTATSHARLVDTAGKLYAHGSCTCMIERG